MREWVELRTTKHLVKAPLASGLRKWRRAAGLVVCARNHRWRLLEEYT